MEQEQKLETIEQRIDFLQHEILTPEVLYHDHSAQLEEIRKLNKQYRQLTGTFYTMDMELRE